MLAGVGPPVAVGITFMLGYAVASSAPDVPSGDTSFVWMPFGVISVCFWVSLIGLTTLAVHTARGVAIASVIFWLVTAGLFPAGVTADGFPPSATTSMLVVSLLSLLPTFLVWSWAAFSDVPSPHPPGPHADPRLEPPARMSEGSTGQYGPDGRCLWCGKSVSVNAQVLHPRYCTARPDAPPAPDSTQRPAPTPAPRPVRDTQHDARGTLPRGWYADPAGRARWRYWGARAWTSWVDVGDTFGPDPSGAPDAAAPSAASRGKGLHLRDVEPTPLAGSPGSHPGAQPPTPSTDGRSGSVVWLVIAEVAAVAIGLMLIDAAPRAVGGEEFASEAVLGFLLAVGGSVLLGVTLVVWLIDVVVRTWKAHLRGR